MADPEKLTLTYLDSHPGDAARVLERMSALECAGLLARVPARVAAPTRAAAARAHARSPKPRNSRTT